MVRYSSSCFLITALLVMTNLGSGHSKHRQCDSDGPSIRFPFKLINDNDTDNSGFGLSCSNKNTILQLPTFPDPVRLLVEDISYEAQILLAIDPDNCLPELFLKFYNSSIYPYQWQSETPTNITFFDCSSIGYRHLRQSYSDGQDLFSCPLYAADLDDSIIRLDLLSCTKKFDVVSPVDAYSLQHNYLSLGWSSPHYDFNRKHKPKKKISTPTIIGATGETCSLLSFISFLLNSECKMSSDIYYYTESIIEFQV